MKIDEKKVKSVITKSKLPDADYVINPYVGCQHGCIYCYADFMKRFTGHSGEKWGSFVDVKINAAETVKKFEGSNILIGSVTDPYQPLEKKYKITRKCLEKLLPFNPKIDILTKSDIILSDLDILKKFKNLRVGISIGILDDKFSKKLEPFAPSPKKRLEVLKKLKQEGINTYLFISPIFPRISDFKKLVDISKEYVDKILFENLNIRANNKKRIFEFLKQNKPGLVPFYEKIQKDNSYWDNFKSEILRYCERQDVDCEIYFNH